MQNETKGFRYTNTNLSEYNTFIHIDINIATKGIILLDKLLLLLIILSKLLGRAVLFLFKYPIKVRQVIEPTLETDFSY